MKKNIYLLVAGVAAIALATSCSDNELTENSDSIAKSKTVTITAGSTDGINSRVAYTEATDGSKIGVAWESTDVINIYTAGGWKTATAFTYKAAKTSNLATFTGTFTTAPSTNDPLYGFVKQTDIPVSYVSTTPVTGLVSTYLTEQDGTLIGAEGHNILVATSNYKDNCLFNFSYKLAIIKLAITLPTSVGSSDVQIALKTTDKHYNNVVLDASTFEPLTTAMGETIAETNNISMTGGTKKDIYLCVYPGSLKGLTVEAMAGGTKLFTSLIGDKTVEAGKFYTKTIDLSSATPKIYILRNDFDKFIFGGDNANLVVGYMPTALSKDSNSKSYIAQGKTMKSAKVTTNGANDVFLTMNDDYRTSRNVYGWNGSKCYEYYGVIKMGTADTEGFITTPAFAALTGTTDVVMSFDLMAWSQNQVNETPVKFSIEGDGTLDKTSISLPVRVANAAGTWTHVTLNIKGATASTKVTLTSTGTHVSTPSEPTPGDMRFLLDNLEVVAK
jgi:hypothetical protein